MRVIILLVLAATCSLQLSFAQVTANVFRRVLMIRTHASEGTAFTIEVDARQYLVTAKHLVAGLRPEDVISVRRGDNWDDVAVKVFRCDEPIDIAVLVPSKQLTVTFPLEPTMDNIRFGQEIYFVGFPYGLFTDGSNVNKLYPLPFLKRGIMSASGRAGDDVVVYVDGNNNPGFSGGPIVFRDLDRGDWTFKVFAVVSGFRHDFSPVLTPKEIKPEEITAEDIAKARIVVKNGHPYRLNETDQLVKFNTGIVVGYGIGHAVNLIKKHPIGPKTEPAFEP
jgi:hypothetical protein